MDDIEASSRSTEDAVKSNRVSGQLSRLGVGLLSPKTDLCLLSSHGAGTVVMKNCEPFVFGPALAMLTV